MSPSDAPAESHKTDSARPESVRPGAKGKIERLTPDKLKALIPSFNGTRTILLDKALATVLLETNTGNRRVSKRRVNQLAEQMRGGQFENTGEPIIISVEGILNNGQHRLLAVIEADVAVEMDVRFGIPRRAFTKTDTGAGRTGADVLAISGVANPTQISTALRLLLAYERGLPEHVRDHTPNDEIFRAYERWPDIVEAAVQVQAYNFPKAVRSTPLYATTFLAMRAPGVTKLQSWLHILATGLEADRDNPAYQLRERLIRGFETQSGTREKQLERFSLMIKSWNLFRKGETVPMRDFRWRGFGKDPEPFPKVIGAKL
jgi:hypothetical protein